MSQMPPPSFPPQGGFQPMPGPPKTNGLAIGSLICGIIGCVQITAIVAIVLGVLGIKKSREPGVGGKGMSIAGMVLGVLWLIGGLGMGGAMYWGYSKYQAMVLTPQTAFLNALATNDEAGARKFTTSEFPTEKITALASQLKTLGKPKKLSIRSFETVPAGKSISFHVSGSADFDNGTKSFKAIVTGDPKNASGFGIEDFTLE